MHQSGKKGTNIQKVLNYAVRVCLSFEICTDS